MSARRLAAVSLVALLVVVAPVGAAGLDPSKLVLSQADVPRGFVLDRSESGMRTNAAELKAHPELRRLFREWGRVTGYEVEFDRGTSKLEARVDVLRTVAGAQALFTWYDREVRKAGLQGLRRARGEVGERSWVYGSPKPSTALTIVVWQQGRVFAGVLGQELSPALMPSLARAQERRIARALR